MEALGARQPGSGQSTSELEDAPLLANAVSAHQGRLMSVASVGQALVDFCRRGRYLDSVDTLYADDVVSVEAFAPPDGSREYVGKEAVRQKNVAWLDGHEVHSVTVDGPFIEDANRFAVRFTFDATDKSTGQRRILDEIGVYTVEGDQVSREEFLYSADPPA